VRVLILSQYYDPEPIPKPGELAAALRERGHEVSVITGLPNYPAGRLYPGARLALLKRERIDGIPVTRTFELPYHGRWAAGRILNYASFMISAALAALVTAPCDVIYVWHPPLTVGVAAAAIGRIKRAPVVYDVQDIWPESAVLSGVLRDGSLVRLMSRLERLVYRLVDHILVVTPGARDNLIGKGVPAAKLTVLPHWIDESLFGAVSPDDAAAVRATYGWRDRFVVLFAGNLGLVQGLETVVRAAECLRHETGILWAFVGDGVDRARLEQLVAERGLGGSVQFIDRQPLTAMPAFFAAADVLLVHLKRSELSNYIIPSKTNAYLATGRPILMAMEGAAADLVRQAKAGVVVGSDDPEALAAAALALRAMPEADRARFGESGRRFLLEHLSKARVLGDYEALLARVMADRTAGRERSAPAS